MSELQALLMGWLTELAAVLPFGFAFGVGMVAAVNPCGFAMLPAYLSLYLGAHEQDVGKRLSISRLMQALLVGATVSSGFVVLFGLAGLVISAGATLLLDVMPALGIVIGGVLVLVGIWMLAGRTLHVGAFERFAGRVGNPRNMSVPGFFLFGLAYGAASLSCTLPAFLAVIGTSIASGSVLAGVGRFFGFGVGMAAVLVTLTLALAFLKQGLVKWLRRAVPYVQLASAILIVLAGAYVISYWLLSGNGGIVSR
ncbi:MAG TPA: cytochrome c biogenesis protein CcdA [Rubrobacter sp.]